MSGPGAGLPAVLGALAALIVAFVSLMAQASLPVFVTRVASAFTVFAAIGMVIRVILADGEARAEHGTGQVANDDLSAIQPGMSVGDILNSEEAVRATEQTE